MWVRKTENDNQTDNKKQDLHLKNSKFQEISNYLDDHIIISCISLYLFFVSMVFFSFKISGNGPRHSSYPTKRSPLSWEEAFSQLPAILFMGLIFIVFVYFLLKYNPKTSFRNPCVCEKCQKIKEVDRSINCKCGGVFRKIDEMKWVDK
ncbi:MAG: hypothetical protein ACOYO1_02100 [Bacteroidales bacterium]